MLNIIESEKKFISFLESYKLDPEDVLKNKNLREIFINFFNEVLKVNTKTKNWSSKSIYLSLIKKEDFFNSAKKIFDKHQNKYLVKLLINSGIFLSFDLESKIHQKYDIELYFDEDLITQIKNLANNNYVLVFVEKYRISSNELDFINGVKSFKLKNISKNDNLSRNIFKEEEIKFLTNI